MSDVTTPHFTAATCGRRVEATYRDGAWSCTRLTESVDLTLSAMTLALHYGQSIFEGFKAMRQADGSVAIFRLRDHLARFQRSAERMCIPPYPVEPLIAAIRNLVNETIDAVPPAPAFLYVRPLIFSDLPGLAPSPGAGYRLLVALMPVEPLFGSAGARLTTLPELIRAAPGGTGECKCAGNYGAAMFAKQRAHETGFDEVLWLDGTERRWIEETGCMNLMYVRGGTLCTPPLTGTILPGITRATLLSLACELGLPSAETPLAIDDDWSDVTEVFSSGTAAGTAHVREIVHEGSTLFQRAEPGPIAKVLGAAYSSVLNGTRPVPSKWLEIIGPASTSTRPSVAASPPRSS